MLRTNPFHPSAFFGIIMNSNKFAFLSRAFAAVSNLYKLIHGIRERHSISRRSEEDSVERGRERTCVTVQSANAEIQLGYGHRRFGGADNIARYLGFLIARPKGAGSAALTVSLSQARQIALSLPSTGVK
jgi:hypothetical protein